MSAPQSANAAVLKVAPAVDSAQMLLELGIESATQIARMGRQQFFLKATGAGIAKREADRIYRVGAQRYAGAVAMYTKFNRDAIGIWPSAIGKLTDLDDPIGKDAVIQWPGGVNMQLYWHTSQPSYPALTTVPENRVYVSPERAPAFVKSFLTFSHGKVVSDNARAPGVEIGRMSDTYRRIRISSVFGAMSVLVTDGHLPYPYGREMTGYEVADLANTLTKAKAAGASVLDGPFTADGRNSAIVQFPGGYIAEVHSPVSEK